MNAYLSWLTINLIEKILDFCTRCTPDLWKREFSIKNDFIKKNSRTLTFPSKNFLLIFRNYAKHIGDRIAKSQSAFQELEQPLQNDAMGKILIGNCIRKAQNYQKSETFRTSRLKNLAIHKLSTRNDEFKAHFRHHILAIHSFPTLVGNPRHTTMITKLKQ